MSGYCATGSVQTAIPPAIVMTIESTEAKIGRSMKNLENIDYRSLLLDEFVGLGRPRPGAGSRGRGGGRPALLARDLPGEPGDPVDQAEAAQGDDEQQDLAGEPHPRRGEHRRVLHPVDDDEEDGGQEDAEEG